MATHPIFEMEAPMANRTLLKNGSVINVFTGEIEQADVLMGDGRILGVGDYEDCEADVVEDVSGSYICPGFIDGHIHVESTTLTPYELARTVIPHGTTAIVADPHEIANVSGMSGIAYMIEASEGLPMTVYMMLPSCVPATPLDESGATLEAKDLRPLYQHSRVLGLGEIYHGRKVVNKGRLMDFKEPAVRHDIWKTVRNSFCLNVLTETDFQIAPQGRKCRVIRTIPDQLLTEEMIVDIDFSKDNGVNVDRDILKLAVIERHLRTGHIGLGFISGIGMKNGAIASSVSHDSHNLIVIGADENDMSVAANRIRTMGGGLIVAADGEILAEMPLPVAGLMSQLPAADAAGQNEAIRRAVYSLSVPENIEPFMTMAFVSLPVIPSLKMTTRGLVDVGRQEIVSLFL